MRHLISTFAQLNESQFFEKVPKSELNDSAVATIVQLVFAIMGAIAVIVLLLASIKYIVSRGDPQGVAKAKNAIIYAAIGVVVAASAFAIVGIVVSRI